MTKFVIAILRSLKLSGILINLPNFSHGIFYI